MFANVYYINNNYRVTYITQNCQHVKFNEISNGLTLLYIGTCMECTSVICLRLPWHLVLLAQSCIKTA